MPLISCVLFPYFELRTEKKPGSFIYSTDRENQAKKIFTKWRPVKGTGKKCRTPDLTIICFNNNKKTAHDKGLPRK